MGILMIWYNRLERDSSRLIEDQRFIVEVLSGGKSMYDIGKFTPETAERKRKKNLLNRISLVLGDQMTLDGQWNDGYDLEK